MIAHKAETLTRADRWLIHGTLFDINGQPMNLEGVAIQWALMDESRNPIATASVADGRITVTNSAGGIIDMAIPHAVTKGVSPGLYSDALRVVRDGEPSTMWAGMLTIADTPFPDP
jgi:hypothetical protein